MRDPGVTVDPFTEPSDLAADVTVRDVVLVRPVNSDNFALLNGNFETAGVGAVEWADCVNGRAAPL